MIIPLIFVCRTIGGPYASNAGHIIRLFDSPYPTFSARSKRPRCVRLFSYAALVLSQVDKAITDVTRLLTHLSERATHFCINLDELVDRNTKVVPIRTRDAIVFQGILRSEGTRLEVKTIRAGLPAGDKKTIEVI